jgi:hypothetical protein
MPTNFLAMEAGEVEQGVGSGKIIGRRGRAKGIPLQLIFGHDHVHLTEHSRLKILVLQLIVGDGTPVRHAATGGAALEGVSRRSQTSQHDGHAQETPASDGALRKSKMFQRC